MGHHVRLPGAEPAPAVQDRHLQAAVRLSAMDLIVNIPELVSQLLDIVCKSRKLISQTQVAAVADAVQRLSHKRSSGRQPVLSCFNARIVSFIKRIRKEIRQKTSFCILHAWNVRDQPQRSAAAHASHHCVQADAFKIRAVGLRADPVVPQEHHGLFPGLMDQRHQLRRLFRHKPLDKIHVIPICLCGHPEGRIVISVVHQVLRAQPVSVLRLKFLQRFYGYGASVAEPVHEFFLRLLVKYQGEMIEKRGEADHIRVRILFQPLHQIFFRKLSGSRLAHVKRNLVGPVPPAVGDVVVHLRGIPHRIHKKAHRIFMKRFRIPYADLMQLWVQFPAPGRHRLPGGPVHNLPPFLWIMQIIRNHLLSVIALHKRNPQFFVRRSSSSGHQIELLALLHMRPGKFVVPSCHKISRIDLRIQLFNLRIQFRPVAVPKRVGTPAHEHLLRLV